MKLTEHVIKCGRCNKTWKVHKYLYRVSLDELDVEEFRPFGRLSVDLCYQCFHDVKIFIFGDPKEMEEIEID